MAGENWGKLGEILENWVKYWERKKRNSLGNERKSGERREDYLRKFWDFLSNQTKEKPPNNFPPASSKKLYNNII